MDLRSARSHEAQRKALDNNTQVNARASTLKRQWGFNLQVPNGQDSPRHRKEKGRTIEAKIIHQMIRLQFKDRLSPAITQFDNEAAIKWALWVRKPKGDNTLLPRISRRDLNNDVSVEEKAELLQLLSDILDEGCRQCPQTPSFERRRQLDDTPIPSQLPKSNRKRLSDDNLVDIQASTKKHRHPEFTAEAQQTSTSMAPPRSRSRPRRPELQPDTSFISDASSVFSAAPSLRNFESNETQTTIPDDESEIATQPNSRPPSPSIEHPQSSEYGSSSMDQFIESFGGNGLPLDVVLDKEMPQGLNDSALEIVEQDPAASDLYARLQRVLPKINPSLESLPFTVLYEITRVCLFNAVPMENFKFTLPAVVEYDSLWSSLRLHPLLKGKPLPPRCHEEVWNAAMSDYKKGTRAVVFSGSLSFSADPHDPFYLLRLEPMRFDASYRQGRRHGNDRYFELDFPQMSGKTAPPILQKLDRKGRVLLVSWLVDGVHDLFGRTWKPFHVKPKERRGRKVETRGEEEFDTAYRIFLFAVDGYGFRDYPSPMHENTHTRVSVAAMMDTARPIAENLNEKFLKLFARTDLIVSKNTPTVVLDRSQIIFKQDIICNGEVMTDGAGQLSKTLAHEVSQKLGLSFVPSGFQGRIGEAKGFWSVDYLDQSGKSWISVYDSQRKWKTLPEYHDEADHPSHHTFEVLRYSAPLKAADLNLQLLPLLQDRAKHAATMETALKDLLRGGLERQLDSLQEAMMDPQAFRVWLREAMSSAGDRLKNECVQYRAGLPVSLDEKLTLFLDAGFDPNKLYYLKDLAWKAFKAKCDELKKRLNITVNKSSYVYMVPDFSETLKENEVYLDFSSFRDESSGFSNASILLNEVDILVARSPAHYVSDIQKVRAIHRVQLMGLKDVIVFPTKGNPSLAAKLSGGDYDGDIAWVCWEPSIVDNFQNADVPKVPDLVKEGLIKKESRTYKQLVGNSSNPTSVFLNASFLFNMEPKMLGICTVYKDKLCYTMETVDSREAVYLSTLLSFLVDQAKQGYIFTEDDWEFFKSKIINRSVQMPSYKTKQVNLRSRHIIDRLVITAAETIERLLTQFQKNTTKPDHWDSDLVKYYEWANQKSKQDFAIKGDASDWHRLVTDLSGDLRRMMTTWSISMVNAGENEPRDKYLARIDKVYEEFINIKPKFQSCLTDVLLPDCLQDADSSDWALLRASALFANFRRTKIPTYVWNIAGIQLAKLKAKYGCAGQTAHSVVPRMYAMLKPDAAYVKKAISQRDVGIVAVDENCSIVNADEMDDFED